MDGQVTNPSDFTFPSGRNTGDNPEHRVAAADEQTNNPPSFVDASARPSIFSNGSDRPTAVDVPVVLPAPHVTESPVLIQRQSASPAPLSTLAGRQSPEQQHGMAELASASHRPRIPRVEKDADDHSTPPQNRDPFSRPDYTPTTLSRLLAINAPLTESRSTSYNTTVEFQPRSINIESSSLPGHLYTQGLLQGKHSDITVNAFGCAYRLHRLMLARAPFFSTALSGQWLESSSKDITLYPEDIDSNITQGCFELALKRLYGASVPQEEASEAVGLFAIGCWLEMSDLVDSSIEAMLRQMNTSTLTPLIKLVTSNYYGKAGDKILASAKAMLCRDGWKMPLKHWDGIPADIVREIVGGDGLFVNSEWDRWLLTKRLLNRRLKSLAIDQGLVQPGTKRVLPAPDNVKLMAIRFDGVYRKNHVRTNGASSDLAGRWVSLYTHPDVEPLLVLLDEGIHYMHLDYEHLQYIRRATDIFGLPVMPEKVISDALWMQLELRQKVMNASDTTLELGLSKVAEDSNPPCPSAETIDITPMSAAKGKKRFSQELPLEDEDDEMASNSWDGNGKPRKFWIPSTDCNIVMGGNSDPVVATAAPSGNRGHVSRLSGSLLPEDVQWASDFGAASNDTRPLPAFPSFPSPVPQPSMDVKPLSYTHFPPFRFAAEFPNPRLLKEKKRVYSRTIFYAGSLWNIYIQKVRSSKNPQLGVYLHRAKERETEEALVSTSGLGSGSVDERIGLLEREMLLRHDRIAAQRRRRRLDNNDPDYAVVDYESSGSADAAEVPVRRPTAAAIPTNLRPIDRLSGPSYRKSRQSTDLPDKRPSSSDDDRPHHPSWPHSTSSSASSDDDDRDGAAGKDRDDRDIELARLNSDRYVPTLPGYVDARPTIKTYFKIYSPSKGGRMLSVYESAPDRFNFSQSWGWKSSTLMLDEGLGGVCGGAGGEEFGEGEGEGDVPRRSEGRLRFMVVIGNV